MCWGIAMRDVKGLLALVCCMLLLVAFGGCESTSGEIRASGSANGDASAQGNEEGHMSEHGGEKTADMGMRINGTLVNVAWERNEAVEALRALVASGDVTIDMSQYGGFEQVGALPSTLPSHDVHITTGPGDIVLYSGNQIVVFYGSNSWAYTKLGRITDATAAKMQGLLAHGDVTLTLSPE